MARGKIHLYTEMIRNIISTLCLRKYNCGKQDAPSCNPSSVRSHHYSLRHNTYFVDRQDPLLLGPNRQNIYTEKHILILTQYIDELQCFDKLPKVSFYTMPQNFLISQSEIIIEIRPNEVSSETELRVWSSVDKKSRYALRKP